MTGLRRDRVAELIVAGAGGRFRGSGYLVTGTSVLTAAHVLDGAESVRVRFEPDLPGEWVTEAVSWWTDPRSDLAVVSIEPRPCEAAWFGRVGERAAVLTVQAVGFPKWKLRDGRYRDSHHAVGTVAVLSNWREGTLEVAVDATPDDSSPWEGMSGAAVWAGDRIIGVLAKHHPTDGPSRLAAIRLDQAVLDRLSITALPDVVPPEPAHVVPAAYRAQLADIAPDELLGREAELSELVQFCAGPTSYAWWQAGPWAGKSALMSWFALHPPAGTDVVSFFVTSRFAGQSDSDAYLDAMLEQLAVLNDEPPQPVEPRARGRHLLRLLDAVAHRCAAAGRRLLVLVDGLDEDTSLAPGVDRPSIASLLPRRPLPGLRVLVSSRPNPALPFDVPADHPLHAAQPRWLQPSSHARHVAKAATAELTRMLAGSELQREVLGLITASGGGLTHPDLQALTGHAPYQIDELLGGLFGRSIRTRTMPDIERVYLFAHETLRERAQASFGATLAAFHERIDTWADSYRTQGWPDTTPAYLVRGYARVLVDRGELPRLLDLATDSARQSRIRTVTGGDALTFGEMSMAHNLIVRSPSPDLGAALRLALARTALAEHSDNLPVGLPAVWVKLGHPTRAAAMANGVLDPVKRIHAYGEMIEILVENDDVDLAREIVRAAETTLREIEDSGVRRFLTVDVAEALERVGQFEHADRLIADTDEVRRDEALGRMAVVTTEPTRAGRLLDKISDDRQRMPVLIRIAAVLTARDDADRAIALTARYAEQDRDFSGPREEARFLSWVAESFVAAGRPDLAGELITEAEVLLSATPDSDLRAGIANDVAAAAAAAGDVNRAEWLVQTFSRQIQPTTALARITVAVAVSEPRRALEYLEEIDDDSDQLPSTYDWTVTNVCEALARGGNHDLALELVSQTELPEKRAWIMTQLLPLFPDTLVELAEATAREIDGQPWSALALTELAGAVAAMGADQEALRLVAAAEAMIRGHSDPARRALILTAAARAVATTGDTPRVLALADVAEAVVGAMPEGPARDWSRQLLAEAMTDLGERDRADRLNGVQHLDLETRIDPAYRFHTFARGATECAAAGDHHGARVFISRCESLFSEIADPIHSINDLAELARAAATIADHELRDHLLDRAERIVATHRIPLDDEDLFSELRTLDRLNASLIIGQAAVETGDYPRIRRRITGLPPGHLRDSMTLTLVTALAKDGELTEATDLVSTIDVPEHKARAWIALAEADAAEAAIHETVVFRNELLSALAVAVARQGDHARAVRLIGETTSPLVRALTLDAITEQSPEPVYRRPVAETLSTEEWLWVLPAVAALDPQALHRFCDQLL